MITNQCRKWLESLEVDPTTGKLKRDGAKYTVYMGRIQKRIDKELDALLWLAATHPEIFLDEEREIRNTTGKVTPHRRLKGLIKALRALNPKMEIEMVLKQALEEIDAPEPIGTQ